MLNIRPIVLPRPLVTLFANKFYLLCAYVATFVVASRDADIGWILGIILSYFHMQYTAHIE
jgi:hypothetical protein